MILIEGERLFSAQQAIENRLAHVMKNCLAHVMKNRLGHVILSAAKDLLRVTGISERLQILRCAQDDIPEDDSCDMT